MSIHMKRFPFLFFLLFFLNTVYGKVVTYNFDIAMKSVNFTGKPVQAMTINNQIPAPAIQATVGDTLEVTFNNNMNVATSIHWHGVLLPNDQDGVPYLTTQPIAPHSSFTYRYVVKQTGTYWYHSHTHLQEQRGLYGSLIFHPKEPDDKEIDQDHVVVLSDWTNENPKRVLANLKKDGDYYLLKKKSVLSWDKVLMNGSEALKNRLHSSITRMGPMDISDIGYDLFLANGKSTSYLQALPGQKVKIRLINASASTYFNVEFAGVPMEIISADGMEVEPISVKRLMIAIAETYDIILPIEENKSYELRATAQDGTGCTSIFIGDGQKVFAPDTPKPNLFLMKMGHEMGEGHGSMEHDHKKNVDHMTDYQSLRSVKDTSFDASKPRCEVILNLTGNMERYTWSFNDKIFTESDKILIKKGEVVRFVLQNQTMMHHPIHLHGHFFHVINGQGDKSPLKHTVNVPAMQKVVIEFEASESGDWFFHCHNLYHMKAGMARSVSYECTSNATRRTFFKLMPDDVYCNLDIGFLSHMTTGFFRLSNTRNAIEFEYDSNYKKEYDFEILYLRNISRYLDVFFGANFERHDDPQKLERRAVFGFRYVLPFLIESNVWVDSNGGLRLSLESALQLTERINFSWFYDTENEYQFSFMYECNKNLLIDVTYDNYFKWGAGIRARF